MTNPTTQTPKVPTRRTVKKFGRDVILAGVSASVVFISNNILDLGLSPEEATMVTAFVNIVYRYVRQVLGAEPVE